ncbi:hypothetical protein BDN72DRAFT_905358 [Pluteus cervinus]|uniref:Uncharacterized protein n=1 Tax=Pluteus cervinus TaxID=181527 RepID=A0ACD3A3M4_9AGAR|nr:hypothetical protein BDN72DRAFT_905358 [Pluteus cervinus]
MDLEPVSCHGVLDLSLKQLTYLALTNHTTTRLPPELFEEIITQAWNYPVSNEERMAFMVSSMLVSKP